MKPLQRHTVAQSFYHLGERPLVNCTCAGLACFAARDDRPERWRAIIDHQPAVYCLGKCYAGPSDSEHDLRPYISSYARRTVLLGNVLAGGVRDLTAYQESGGGVALAKARAMAPHELVRMMQDSELRGRGGAGYPTGIKWRAVANEPALTKYVVVNADEGDPGAFSDRFLLEEDPFRIIEGAMIAAYAVGARRGFIYVRKEYPLAARILGSALEQARAAGWLDSAFDVELVIGQGAYICGEETALLNALEGRRPEARQRPPQVSQHGLFNAPTLVNNVETLCAVPWIVTHGAAAYADLGFSRSRGTKLLSLNSLFCRPGLYEVEFGLPLTAVVDELGQGLHRGKLKGLMIGGPLAGIVPPELLTTLLGYEELQAIDCAVGHGGVIAFADSTPILDIITEVFRFGARESCGECTPCHFGTPVLAEIAEAAAAGGPIDAVRYRRLIEALAATSLCGHGRGIAEFALSVHRHFREELKIWLD